METFLKWAGGKRWLLDPAPDREISLRGLYEPYRHRRLVDLFTGAGSVAFGLAPQRALVNDLNPHLVNCLRYAMLGVRKDMAAIEFANDKEIFAANRHRFNHLAREGVALPEQALLFYYLNRTCYNGLCRFNRKGEFNVPFGKYKTIHYLQDWDGYVEGMRHWKITCGDFSHVHTLPGDFLFADPPYDGGGSAFTAYWSSPFTWEDQVRLARFLARHDGPVIATNLATDRILTLYRNLGFVTHLVSAPRRVSCKTRAKVIEMVATKGV